MIYRRYRLQRMTNDGWRTIPGAWVRSEIWKVRKQYETDHPEDEILRIISEDDPEVSSTEDGFDAQGDS